MDYSTQSLHRLPILNYDDGFNDANANAQQMDFKSVRGDNVRNDIECRNVEKADTQKKNADVKNQKSKLRRKSTSRKTLKETLSIYSSYVRRLLRPSGTVKSIRKSKKPTKQSRQKNEIKVLFSSEPRKLTNKRRNINKDLINEIYDFNVNNNLGNTYNTSSRNVKNRQKVLCCEAPIRTRNSRTKSKIKKDNCNNLCEASSKSCHSCEIPAQYKVVSFPDYDQTDTELEAINIERNNVMYQCQIDNRIGSQDEKLVNTSIPYWANARRGGGDASVSIQCIDLKKDLVEQNKSKNNRVDHSIDPLMIHEHALRLAKIALKYLIFALALIVWSPCIITLYCCWLVTYPLRPKYTSTNAAGISRRRRKSQAKLYTRGSKTMTDDANQTCGINIWSLLLKNIFWAYQPLVVSFGAFKSLLNPETNQSYFNKDRVMTSDPERKYTLYYNRNKGWIMKSTKRCPTENNNISCNLKKKPKVTYEPNCVQRIDGRTPVRCGSRYPQCSRRAHPGKYTIDNCKKTYKQTGNASRHKHLCADTSGLPVHVKLLNPMFNYNSPSKRHVKPHQIRHKPFPRKPLDFPEQCNKKRPRCKAIRDKILVSKQEPSCRVKSKFWCYCNNIIFNIKSIVNDVENEVFGEDMCRSLYINSLRRTPWLYIYKKWPSFYPIFLGIYRFYENLCHLFLLFISACIWCPLLAFCYLCYIIICRSL